MKNSVEALRAAIERSGGSGTPKLTDEAFLGLRGLIADASGIVFDERSRFILERRLAARLRALRLETHEQYYRYLLFDDGRGEELARMLDQVAVRETYFFREPQQLDAFRRDLLPRLAEENAASRRLRIWSAGCATGEEPYTIAMIVLESGLFEGWEVDIFGTDLSQVAVGQARRGLFRDGSMRALADETRARYFAFEGPNAWRLDERVRRMVTFGTLNLVDTARYEVYAGADVIFCRNVLIYFGAETRRMVVNRFYETLREGGYLLLGHAETLVSLNTPFKLLHLPSEMVYRR
jgi:chemotaxis protein methyltransferase CheR